MKAKDQGAQSKYGLFGGPFCLVLKYVMNCKSAGAWKYDYSFRKDLNKSVSSQWLLWYG